MLDRLAASAHRIWILVQARLHGIDNVLMLPPLDAALRSLRALSLQRARAARVGPVMAQDHSISLVREVVGELLTGRTNVNVLLSQVAKLGPGWRSPKALDKLRHAHCAGSGPPPETGAL
jgi:hypothetical protein